MPFLEHEDTGATSSSIPTRFGTTVHNGSGRSLSTRSTSLLGTSLHAKENSGGGVGGGGGGGNSSGTNDSEARSTSGRIRAITKSKGWQLVTILCTIWVLGGDDVYILSDAPLSADRGVHTLYVVCAAQFLCDLVVRTVVEPGFRGSFFFWLELVALISIAPEVIFAIWGLDIFDIGMADLARSGRLASAATRAVRILRIIKLLRPLMNWNKRNIREHGFDDNDLGDTSATDLAKKLEKFITIHVDTAICTHA